MQGQQELSYRVVVDWVRQINWRREALFLASVGMDACLLAPWYLVLRSQGAMLQGVEPAGGAVAATLVTTGLLLAVILTISRTGIAAVCVVLPGTLIACLDLRITIRRIAALLLLLASCMLAIYQAGDTVVRRYLSRSLTDEMPESTTRSPSLSPSSTST